MGLDPTRAYFWPAVNKRPTQLWPWYFLTRPDEIFFYPKGKKLGFSKLRSKPKMADLTWVKNFWPWPITTLSKNPISLFVIADTLNVGQSFYWLMSQIIKIPKSNFHTTFVIFIFQLPNPFFVFLYVMLDKDQVFAQVSIKNHLTTWTSPYLTFQSFFQTIHFVALISPLIDKQQYIFTPCFLFKIATWFLSKARISNTQIWLLIFANEMCLLSAFWFSYLETCPSSLEIEKKDEHLHNFRFFKRDSLAT